MRDRCLGVALGCLSAACVIALAGLFGAERVAAFGLLVLAGCLVTVCLAAMADGRGR